MVNRSRSLALGTITLASLFALYASVRSTEAAPPKPPMVASCGTIDGIPYQDLNGNTVICLVWLSDRGGTYRFGDIEDYNIGDRVFVRGTPCTYCTPFCGGAVPILNAIDTPCP